MMCRGTFSAEPGRRAGVLIALVLACTMPAWASEDSPVETLEVVQPHQAGYQLGDKFERRVTLRLRKPYELVTAALPEPARITPWLALEPVEVSRFPGGRITEYDIRFRYQVVNFVPGAPDIPIPHHVLRLSDGNETLTALVQPARTHLAPLPLPEDATMQPDDSPQPLAPPMGGLLVSWFVFLIAALLLFAIYRRIPLGSTRRPFSAASRRLERMPAGDWQGEQARAALAVLHKAFNDTAGNTVFEGDIENFLASHAGFLHLEDRITGFFRASRRYFFVDGELELGAAEVLELARACADAERGVTP